MEQRRSTFVSDGLSVLVEQVSLGTPNVTNTFTGALAQRYAASGLNNGSEYAFRVAGFAHGVATPYSAVTNLIPMATPALTLDYQSKGTISLSWGAIAGVDKYVLERKADSGSFAAISPLIAGSDTTYTDTNFTDGVIYTYRLKARNKYSQDAGYSNMVAADGQVLLTAATVTLTPNTPIGVVMTVATATIAWTTQAKRDYLVSMGGIGTGCNITLWGQQRFKFMGL